MTKLDSILKNRDITLPTKVRLVKAMVLPGVMYGWESWTVKKAECWRIEASEQWCSRRLLRVPWIGRRSSQCILKEIIPGCSLEELMLKLKRQYFWPPHAKSLLIGKGPDAGRDWGQEEKGATEDEMAGWHHRLDAHEFEETLGVGDGQGGLACCSSWGCKELDTTEWLNWLTDWFIEELLRIAKKRTQHVSSNRRMYKQIVVYTDNGILLSLIKDEHFDTCTV